MNIDKRSQKSLLDDIAYSTAIDPSLAAMVSVAPHASTLIANQALYVSLLVSQLKAGCFAANLKKAKKNNAALQSSTSLATPLQVQICVVGCGTIGTMIVDGLLKSESIHPTSLSVVTRQPELLTRITNSGVRCFRTVDDVIDCCDLFIIAVQPGQFSTVAKSMKGKISKRTVCLSLCCGIPVEKQWTKQDDSIARFQRAAYAASKTFAEVKDSMTDEEKAIVEMPAHQRRAMRMEQVLEQSFPAAMTAFYNRLSFILVSSCMARGIPAPKSARLVWMFLFPHDRQEVKLLRTNPPESNGANGTDNMTLIEYTSFQNCAAVLEVDPRILFVWAKDKFHDVLRSIQGN